LRQRTGQERFDPMAQTTLTEEAAPSTRSLWTNRNFMLLWSGQTARAIGPQITLVLLPLIALQSLRAGTSKSRR
jgi:hypothetical protein